MECIKCGKGIPDAAPYCCWCGKKQQQTQRKSLKRGNGTGSVYRQGDKWVAAITKGYRIEGDKKKRIVVKKCGLKTKKEAIEYLTTLAGKPQREKDITWRALYELWLPTHRAGKSTMDCYKSAEKYFAPLEFWKLKEIEIDDLQECLDDCPKGRRTKENMKALCGLMYKYAIPRGYAPLNPIQNVSSSIQLIPTKSLKEKRLKLFGFQPLFFLLLRIRPVSMQDLTEQKFASMMVTP